MTITGRYKAFDRDLYNLHNDSSIERVIKHITEVSGLYAAPNTGDRFGPDIVVYKGFQIVSYVEVEIVLKWTTPEFPWPVVNLPERKEKYLDLGLPIEFWRISADKERVVIVPDYVIDREKHRQIVPNSKIKYGEKFFRVPLDLCIVKDL